MPHDEAERERLKALIVLIIAAGLTAMNLTPTTFLKVLDCEAFSVRDRDGAFRCSGQVTQGCFEYVISPAATSTHTSKCTSAASMSQLMNHLDHTPQKNPQNAIFMDRFNRNLGSLLRLLKVGGGRGLCGTYLQSCFGASHHVVQSVADDLLQIRSDSFLTVESSVVSVGLIVSKKVPKF